MTDVDVAASDRQIRPFADVLLELNGGASHNELSEALNEVAQAVSLHGKPGSITFTLKIRSAGRNSTGTVMVTDEVKIKMPEGERPDSVFFLDRQGNMRREPSEQIRLPLREVPGAVVVTEERPDPIGAADG